MNWKKLLVIAIAVAGFAFVAPSRSDAGIAVGIGLGFPGVYAYPAYYPYAYPYYQPVVYVGPAWYWWHGHRVYYPRHHHYWR